jgi:heme A synthase
MTLGQKRLARYACSVLLYNLLVILWGAFVRATGSGAGCGAHWPLCNGQIIPRPEYIETWVEFSHRASSGIALLLVVGLFFWARRAFPQGHIVRTGAKLSLFFIVLEALIGAGLVLFELVAHNPSLTRAVSISLHLVNTFLLVAVLTLTAFWVRGGQRLRLRNQGALAWLLGVGLIGMLLVGASGAVTALGDTLFPASSLQAGMAQDFSPTAHFLVRLRVLHPIFAVAVGVYSVAAGSAVRALRPSRATTRLFWVLAALFILQFGVGLLNVWLLAPVWMQLAHLLLADVVWIAFVLLAATALSQDVPQREAIGTSEGLQVRRLEG